MLGLSCTKLHGANANNERPSTINLCRCCGLINGFGDGPYTSLPYPRFSRRDGFKSSRVGNIIEIAEETRLREQQSIIRWRCSTAAPDCSVCCALNRKEINRRAPRCSTISPHSEERLNYLASWKNVAINSQFRSASRFSGCRTRSAISGGPTA